MTQAPVKLRSAAWPGTADENGFMASNWIENQGIPDHEFSLSGKRPATAS